VANPVNQAVGADEKDDLAGGEVVTPGALENLCPDDHVGLDAAKHLAELAAIDRRRHLLRASLQLSHHASHFSSLSGLRLCSPDVS
jgi:hypothetical protein